MTISSGFLAMGFLFAITTFILGVVVIGSVGRTPTRLAIASAVASFSSFLAAIWLTVAGL